MAQWFDRLPPNILRMGINLWPPFRFSGIKVLSIAPDYRKITVCLKMRWYNRNYVGTHFGGSIFSMSDPFFMLMLLKNLGARYIVWDKAAAIEFIKPGKGVLTATFTFTEEELQAIKAHTDQNEKWVFDKAVDIVNGAGEVVASVVKTLYVRRK